MAKDETEMFFFGDNPEPCLAGTFALMSLYRDNPCSPSRSRSSVSRRHSSQ